MIVPGIAVGIVTNLVPVGYSSFFSFAVADSSILLNRESPAYEYGSMKWILVNQLPVLQFQNIEKMKLDIHCCCCFNWITAMVQFNFGQAKKDTTFCVKGSGSFKV